MPTVQSPEQTGSDDRTQTVCTLLPRLIESKEKLIAREAIKRC